MLAALLLSGRDAVATVAVLRVAGAEYWPDGVIQKPALLAGLLQWYERPDLLLNALVESGIVVKSEKYGYLIADWPNLCPPSVKAKLRRSGRDFCEEYLLEIEHEQAKPVQTLSSESAAEPEVPAIRVVRCVDGDYPVLQSQVDRWQEVYQAIDVLHVIDRSMLWLENNTGRGATKKHMANWIIRWLNKEQSDGRRSASYRDHGTGRPDAVASKRAKPLFSKADSQ